MMKIVYITLALGLSLLFRSVDAQDLPHLEKRGKATQLIVDGKPYLILGGELHNSSSSDLNYLKPPFYMSHLWMFSRHCSTKNFRLRCPTTKSSVIPSK